MLSLMSDPVASSVIGRQNWLQHHLPWLAALSLIMGLFRDEAVAVADRDDWLA